MPNVGKVGKVGKEFHWLASTLRIALPELKELAPAQQAQILLTYDGLVRPHFIPLLRETHSLCLSRAARNACEGNLECKVSEDHPGMLKEFVDPIRAMVPDSILEVALRRGQPLVDNLYEECRIDGLAGITIMAALENSSLIFIPWIEAAAKLLGITNLTYTKKHGAADIQHAEDFKNAILGEVTAQGRAFSPVPVRKVAVFLAYIFKTPE